MTLDEEVMMPLWALVHSVRYAMGRSTFANCDAASLAKRYWDDLPDFIREQFREDFYRVNWDGPLREGDRVCWLFMFDEVKP